MPFRIKIATPSSELELLFSMELYLPLHLLFVLCSLHDRSYIKVAKEVMCFLTVIASMEVTSLLMMREYTSV